MKTSQIKTLQAKNAWRAAPSFLNPLIAVSRFVARRKPANIKAGLLAPPPFQQPSHYDQSKQWRIEAERVPLKSIGKVGVTAAGPLPIFTGFPIKREHLNVFLIEKMSHGVKYILALKTGSSGSGQRRSAVP
jgi:hypothetical protein